MSLATSRRVSQAAHSSTRYMDKASLLKNEESLFSLGFRNTENQPISKNSVLQLSVDIGRTEVKFSFVHSFRIFFWSIWMLFSATGFPPIQKVDNSIMVFILKIIEGCSLSPDLLGESIITIIMQVILFSIVFGIMLYNAQLLKTYNDQHTPSTLGLHTWIILNRLFLMIFPNMIGHSFGYYLGVLFNGNGKKCIGEIVFSFLSIIIYVGNTIFASYVYNSTPLIRIHDKTQPWFCYNFEDLFFSLFPTMISIIPFVLNVFFTTFTTVIVFSIGVSIAVGFSIFFIIQNLPYIHPNLNVIHLCVFSSVIPFTTIGIFVEFYSSGTFIAFLICVFLFIVSFVVSRFIVKHAELKAVNKFLTCRQMAEENLPQNNLLPYNFLSDQNEPQPDFDFFINCDYRQVNLFVRIGYIFDIPEVTEKKFAKWCFETGASEYRLVYTLCQVIFLIGKDINQLSLVLNSAQSLTKGPLNSDGFIFLTKSLKQEMLTQLNESLMEALSQAKVANFRVQAILGEFWGFVLKQNMDGMKSLIPIIAEEGYQAELLYLKLTRWYPNTTLVLKQTSVFLHKTLGQHQRALKYISVYGKVKRNGNDSRFSDSECESVSVKSDDVDVKFKESMDPWIAAEEALSQVPNHSGKQLNILLTLLALTLILIPFVFCIVDLIKCSKFTENFRPINSIAQIQYIISRLPHIFRIIQIHSRGDYHIEDFPEIGRPEGVENEVLSIENAFDAVTKHIKNATNTMSTFRSHCLSISEIYDKCLVKKYNWFLTPNLSKSATAYEMIQLFIADASYLLNYKDTIDWTNIQNLQQTQRIFNNFNETFSAIHLIVNELTNSLLIMAKAIQNRTFIFSIVLWVLPAVIIIPSVISFYLFYNRRLEVTLRLLFQIPKSQISTLHLSGRFKSRGRLASKDENRNLSKNPTTTESQMDLNANGSKSSTSRPDDTLEGISTVPRRSGEFDIIFFSIIFVYYLISCSVCQVGIYMYERNMEKTIPTALSYEKGVLASASMYATSVYFQEVFTNSEIFYNLSYSKHMTKEYTDFFAELLNDVFYGNENTHPAYFDNEKLIDAFVRSMKKSFPLDSDYNYSSEPVYGILHSAYSTISGESLIVLLRSVTYKACNNNNVFSLNQSLPYHYQHMTLTHLTRVIENATSVMYNEAQNNMQDTIFQIVIIFALLLLFQILYSSFVFRIAVQHLQRQISTPRMFMGLIAPNTLLKCQPILRWMAGKFKSGHLDTSMMGRGVNLDFILAASKSALFLTNSNLIIERVNETASTMFEIDREKTDQYLIGQNMETLLSKIIKNPDKGKVIDRLHLVIKKLLLGRSKSGKRLFTIIIKKEDGQTCYLNMLVRGHSSKENSDVIRIVRPPATSFSFAFYDKTAEHYQEELVQVEKQRGEQLVQSFIPKVISRRMNDGENDLFFEVQNATIMFSSISGWSEMIESMTAQQVMQILNKIYLAYDEELREFPSITKLKTMGHVYMIAVGLFSDMSVNHADVAIRYSLKLFERIAQINDEMNWNLSISVGINSGGPIDCGIIGKVRPVFDIIGDTVNVASKMNSMGLENYIHLAESTYDLVKYLSYPIRDRGEIKLKGKISAQRTYLISPLSHLSQSGLLKHSGDNFLDRSSSSSSILKPIANSEFPKFNELGGFAVDPEMFTIPDYVE